MVPRAPMWAVSGAPVRGGRNLLVSGVGSEDSLDIGSPACATHERGLCKEDIDRMDNHWAYLCRRFECAAFATIAAGIWIVTHSLYFSYEVRTLYKTKRLLGRVVCPSTAVPGTSLMLLADAKPLPFWINARMEPSLFFRHKIWIGRHHLRL